MMSFDPGDFKSENFRQPLPVDPLVEVDGNSGLYFDDFDYLFNQ